MTPPLFSGVFVIRIDPKINQKGSQHRPRKPTKFRISFYNNFGLILDPFWGQIWPLREPILPLLGPSGPENGSPGPPWSSLGPPTVRVGAPEGSTFRPLCILGLFFGFRGTNFSALGALRSGLVALRNNFWWSRASPGMVFGLSKARFFKAGTDFPMDSAPRPGFWPIGVVDP